MLARALLAACVAHTVTASVTAAATAAAAAAARHLQSPSAAELQPEHYQPGGGHGDDSDDSPAQEHKEHSLSKNVLLGSLYSILAFAVLVCVSRKLAQARQNYAVAAERRRSGEHALTKAAIDSLPLEPFKAAKCPPPGGGTPDRGQGVSCSSAQHPPAATSPDRGNVCCATPGTPEQGGICCGSAARCGGATAAAAAAAEAAASTAEGEIKAVKSPPTALEEARDVDGDAICAVCLCGFESGEMLRVVPHCNHRYHQACLDTWLATKGVCPLCKQPVHEPAEPWTCRRALRIVAQPLRECFYEVAPTHTVQDLRGALRGWLQARRQRATGHHQAAAPAPAPAAAAAAVAAATAAAGTQQPAAVDAPEASPV